MAFINFRQNTRAFKQQEINEIERIHNRVLETFNYIIGQYSAEDENLRTVLGNRVFELSNVYRTNINIYSLNGLLLGSNRLAEDSLSSETIDQLKKVETYTTTDKEEDHMIAYNNYSYINIDNQPVAILNTLNKIDSNNNILQSIEYLKYYFFVVVFLIVISGCIAWIISKNLTKKIDSISNYLENTDVASLNQPIEYKTHDEVKPLIDAYNNMLVRLKIQTDILQKNERVEAWIEMAKQIAHEINNPLTPLRLTVQNFQRKYNPEDPNNVTKVKNLTDSVVHHIDIISSIARSFSDFAQMPTIKNENINVIEQVRRSIDIFPPSIVEYTFNTDYIAFRMDPLYLTRIITNIIKNGIQASSGNSELKILVEVSDLGEDFLIKIQDNGHGIPLKYQDKVFQPNFTTKSTGMGLGLPMVKKIVEDYNGSIWFETQENIGTTFFIKFKK